MKHFYRLSPIVAPWLRDFTNDVQAVQALFCHDDTPVFLGCTDPFVQNIAAFRACLRSRVRRSQIFFARKPNHCVTFARTALREGIGVDCASEREMHGCIGSEANGPLTYSAAIKTRAAVDLAIAAGASIVVDSADELRLVAERSASLGHTAEIALRISGFPLANGAVLQSRFGFAYQDRWDAAHATTAFPSITVRGLHFHLDGYSVEERATGLALLIGFHNALQQEGLLHPDFVDIGGGFLVNYLADGAEWQQFQVALQAAAEGYGEPITYRNNLLHLANIDGRVHNIGNLYPYRNEDPKERMLAAVLDTVIDGRSLAARVDEAGIELRIEPGRSLLDQCGCTLARVVHRKRDPNGLWLVGLDMNFTQLLSSSVEFAVDPLFLPCAGPVAASQDTDVVLTGAYCMERDVILKRILRLPRLPKIGDVVAFVNTAGYMSHFLATTGHLADPPRNLFLESATGAIVKDDYQS